MKRHERPKVKSHRHRESLLILLYHIFKEFKAVHIDSEHHILEEFLLNSSYTGNLDGSLEQRLAFDPLIWHFSFIHAPQFQDPVNTNIHDAQNI